MRRSIAALCSIFATACGGDDGPAASPEGCDGAPLLARPADPAARGPWVVGARTETLPDGLAVEVWYPAKPGSEAGATPARYDIRQALPASEIPKIPDADNPWQSCDCYRDLPIDDTHGPFPVVVFVHGTASFRHQSLALVTHWASRGFVVIAADHPGLRLGDVLAQACGGSPPAQNLARDLDAMFAAMTPAAPGLAFLDGRADTARVAVAGHSAGAGAAAAAATRPGVQVIVSMAGAQPTAQAAVTSVFLAGTRDGVVAFNRSRMAFDASPTPRYFVGLEGAGHLAFSDLCATKNAAGQDLLQIAQEKQVCGAQLAGFLFDCDPTYLANPTGWAITNHAVSAVLEHALQCRSDASPSAIQSAFPEVSHYVEAL